MVHEVSAGVVSPDALAILLYALFSFVGSQCQKETALASLSWLGCSPYHFAFDLADLKTDPFADLLFLNFWMGILAPK